MRGARCAPFLFSYLRRRGSYTFRTMKMCPERGIIIVGVQYLDPVPFQEWRKQVAILIFIVAVLLLDVLAFLLGADSRKTIVDQCRSMMSRAQI